MTGILPLWHGCPKIAGRAMTMKFTPEATHSTVIGTLEAIQASTAGDVLVIDNGGRAASNSFGGIAAFSARRRDPGRGRDGRNPFPSLRERGSEYVGEGSHRFRRI